MLKTVRNHPPYLAYKISMLHKDITCAQCHRQSARLDKTCEGCHREIAEFMQGNLAQIKGSADYHAKTSCTECHPLEQSIVHISDYSNVCTPCHQNKVTITTMLYDWPASFEEHRKKIEDRLKSAGASARRQELLEKLERYKLHNIRFSHKVLDCAPTYK